MWNIQKLGLLGEIDHYCGVFWWKQSAASNPSYPQCAVTFMGNWNDQDVVWLRGCGSVPDARTRAFAPFAAHLQHCPSRLLTNSAIILECLKRTISASTTWSSAVPTRYE
jgi:hypothetical protein